MKVVFSLAATFFIVAFQAAGGSADAGKAVYDQKCKACHAADGAGNPGMAKMLKVTIKHLGSQEVQAKPDAELKKSVTDGIGKMKPVAGVSAKQVDDVVAYVRTLKK
ncbi:MAG: cytochrome c [Acidobacteria bacterium]|nr:cytochrome c [Acidobacteriota bacterium]